MTDGEGPVSVGMTRQGHYAGGASRLAAFAVDVGASWGLFTLGAAALNLAAQLILGRKINVTNFQLAGISALLIWEFVYFAYQWALSGRTIGMALVGVRVVRRDGAPLNGRRAILRTIFLPLGFLTLGLGYLGIVVGRERRAVYDVIADTAVVYSWDARASRLRWLARQDLAPTPQVVGVHDPVLPPPP